MSDYATIEELLEGERGTSAHVECSRDAVDRAVRFVHRAYADRRRAFYVESDKGFDRDTVRSYLRFFVRIAGGSVAVDKAIARFDLENVAMTPVKKLTPERRALMNFARMSLFEPEVVFCEHPPGRHHARHTQPRSGLARPGRRVGRHRHHLRGAAARSAADARHGLLRRGRDFYQAQTDDTNTPEYVGDEARVFKVMRKYQTRKRNG